MSYAETLSPQAVYAVSATVLRSMEHNCYSVTVTDDDEVAQVIEATASVWTSYASAGFQCQSGKLTLFTVVPDSARFRALVSQWRKERGATSSITEMVLCPSHLSIIAMGPAAIPLILREMENEGEDPDMWFVALQLLTDSNPVTDDARGNFKKMAALWLDWAHRHGYVW